MYEVKVYQQLLFITTKTESIRSEAEGWGAEFGNLGVEQIQRNPDVHIGLVRTHPSNSYCYKTPAHAMRFGWKLFNTDIKPSAEGYQWTMFRNVDKDGNVVG